MTWGFFLAEFDVYICKISTHFLYWNNDGRKKINIANATSAMATKS
jgi:hypothetical protein